MWKRRLSSRMLSQNELYTIRVRDGLPCPITGYGRHQIDMTRSGFERACLKNQRHHFPVWSRQPTSISSDPGEDYFYNGCNGCAIGRAIKSGTLYETPKGIRFVELETLKARRT